MKHTSQIEFGRPGSAVQPLADGGPDKWQLLQDLTQVAADLDLSHRTLSVLKALLTFLPTREVPAGPAAVVFASNKTLSERLSGMPESTLRRHLSALVRAGIVSRHDSPNRKRYARQSRGQIAMAFGFDVSPLVQMQAELGQRAAKAQARQERLVLLRERVMLLRAAVIEAEGQGAETDAAARLLRRRPCEADLRTACQGMQDKLDAVLKDDAADEMSASDSQNERHIQDSDKYDFDSERDSPLTPDRDEGKAAEKKNEITVGAVTSRCHSFKSYFPERVRGWHDMVRIGDRLAPMLGIEPPVLHQAKRAMGHEVAAVVVLCILEKITSIRSPGAYLRHLSKQAGAGGFSVLPMLKALNNHQIVS